MNLTQKPIGSGTHKMWALDGIVINGREFHSFCRRQKTKPSKLTRDQIELFLSKGD